MKSIPYGEYTENEDSSVSRWHYISHLSDSCASMDFHGTSATEAEQERPDSCFHVCLIGTKTACFFLLTHLYPSNQETETAAIKNAIPNPWMLNPST